MVREFRQDKKRVLATILRPNHMYCSVSVSAAFSNILSAGYSTLVPEHYSALSLVSFYIAIVMAG